jgi:predicted Zn-dependent protease with MMP-like domain
MRFDDVVRSALDRLPSEIAAGLRNVAIVVEEENADDPDLYGLFDGVPLTEGGPGAGELPGRIAIYRRPLVADFPNEDELREEIRITVLHELGHYFGLDEDRLAELGYE